MSGIRLYVEGGGDQADTLRLFRVGLGEFLGELRACARRKRLGWQIIACGSRNATFQRFVSDLPRYPDAFMTLLVDAEGPVRSAPWQHLRQRDGWARPQGTSDEQCHLMIQNMEAWLIADPGALADYYGQGFNRNAIPANRAVEQIGKDALARSLERATQRTQKGAYHKIYHGTALLGRVNPAIVRAAAPSCDRLFATLAERMGGCP